MKKNVEYEKVIKLLLGFPYNERVIELQILQKYKPPKKWLRTKYLNKLEGDGPLSHHKIAVKVISTLLLSK